MKKLGVIPTSLAAATVAFGVSAAAHLAALLDFEPPTPVMVEGGASTSVALQGASFADLAQGVAEPVEAEILKTNAPNETHAPVGDVAKALEPVAPRAQRSTELEAIEPAQRTVAQNAAPAPVAPTVTSGDVVAAIQPPAPAINSPVSGASTQRPPINAQVTTAIAKPVAQVLKPNTTQQVEPHQQPLSLSLLAAVPENDTERLTTPRISLRPSVRPQTVEKEAARVAEERAAAKRAAREATAKARSQPKPAGNANQNARRGASGAAQQSAASTGGGQSRNAGTAAISNYRGKIQSCAARAASRARGGGRGTVSLQFSVSSSGRIGSVTTNGNARAAKAVRNAVSGARCPRPPAGAPRVYNVNILLQ